MNETSSDLSAFLTIVERDRAARCQAILRDAETRAAELLRAARSDARRRVSTAVRDDRARGRQRIEAARAELSTRERRLQQEVAATLLSRAWDRLRTELALRWERAETRAHWVGNLTADAVRLLPAGTWTIQHPAGLDPGELEPLARAAAEVGGAPPSLEAHEEIEAGVRVQAAGATLDGTPEGVLADRPGVEGRLLMDLYASNGSAGGSR